jgi:hypothetical protein
MDPKSIVITDKIGIGKMSRPTENPKRNRKAKASPTRRGVSIIAQSIAVQSMNLVGN